MKFFKSKTKFKIKCNKCGEIVNVFVNKDYDLQQNFDGPCDYILQKEVQDTKCFTIMKLYAEFDRNKNLIRKSIEKGEFVET